jgi:hypothetical protein
MQNAVSNNTPTVGVFTDLVLGNGFHNTFFLLLRAGMLQALPNITFDFYQFC